MTISFHHLPFLMNAIYFFNGTVIPYTKRNLNYLTMQLPIGITLCKLLCLLEIQKNSVLLFIINNKKEYICFVLFGEIFQVKRKITFIVARKRRNLMRETWMPPDKLILVFLCHFWYYS